MDEEYFPRGGISRKSDTGEDTTVKKERAKPDADTLFKDEAVKKVKKAKKRKIADTEKDDDEEEEKKRKVETRIVTLGPSEKKITTLLYKDMVEGMLLLGAIREIHDYELVISLPHGRVGYVEITDISEVYTRELQRLSQNDNDDDLTEEGNEVASLHDIFQEGQYVRCAVKEVSVRANKFKRVRLSLDPKIINDTYAPSFMKYGLVLPGVISSVEDHGYVVDLGIRGVRAFLNFTFAKRYIETRNGGKPLLVGQLVDCYVKEVMAEGRSVTLNINPTKLQKEVAKKVNYPYLHLIIPGTRVAATVTEVMDDHVHVNYLSRKGVVNHFHFKEDGEKPKRGDEVTACIIYNYAATKTVGLTLQSSICDRIPKPKPAKALRLGKTFKHAVIKQIHGKHGVRLQIKDKFEAYVQASNLSDDKITVPIGEKFVVGSKVRCRIIGYSCLDGIAIATMKSSTIDKAFLVQSDVKIGMKVEVTVANINNYGIQVQVTNNIRGFIPHLHIADVPLKNPEKKFKMGDVLMCKVMFNEPKRRRLILTHKATLIESELPFLSSYDKAEPNAHYHGMVINIGSYGCIVSFASNVKGLIPKSHLADHPIDSPEEMFYLGQVLKCRVTHCNPKEKKLKLSLRSYTSRPIEVEVPADFVVGKLTDVKVVSKTEDGLRVAILPSNLPALLPKMHLSDSVANAEALFSCYQPDDVISDVMYLTNHKRLIVTLKPSLINASREHKLVGNFKDLETGLILAGVIKRIAPYGVFVEFPRNLTGLCPKLYMADIYVGDSSVPYKEGQSVSAKILEIDEEKKRFLVSLKPSQCHPSHDGGINLLQCYLQERESVVERLEQISSRRKIADVRLGSVVMATVRAVQENGLLLQLDNGTTAVASAKQAEGVDCTEGSEIKVCVLHVNYDSNVAEVTLKANIIKMADKDIHKEKLTKETKLQKLEACVELVKDDVVIVSHSNGQLALLPGRKHLNDGMRMKSDILHVGQMINIIIKKSIGDFIIATQDESMLKVPEISEKNFHKRKFDFEKRRIKSAKVIASKVGIELGSLVSIMVKSVKDAWMHVVTVDSEKLGRVHVSEILDKPTEGQYPLKAFKPGQKMDGKVIGYRDIKHNKFLPITHSEFQQVGLEITLKPSKVQAKTESISEFQFCMDHDKRLGQYKAGDTVWCYIDKFENEYLNVDITSSVRGEIHRSNLSKDSAGLKAPEKHFKTGQAYKAVVLEVDTEHRKLKLTRAGPKSQDLKVGDAVDGEVKDVLQDSLLVQLPGGQQGKVFITDLFDQFVDKPLDKFQENQHLRCCILDCKDKRHITLSARQSRVDRETSQTIVDSDIQSIDDVTAGDLVKGYVKNNTDVGVFVSLCRNLHGRVELKNLSSFFVRDATEAFQVGQLVTAKVLSIDRVRKRIELSLHPQHTDLEDQLAKKYRGSLRASNDSAKIKHAVRRRRLRRKREEDGSDSGIDGVLKDAMDSDSEVEIITSQKPTKESKLPRLEISGFNWSDKLLTEEDTVGKESSDESDDEDKSDVKEQPPQKKTKKEKLQEKKEMEAYLYRTENAMMDPDRAPETVDDFDRLVVGSPDSSIVWIQYMAFHLHTTEIDKARVVAERALKTISYREEQEKLNVWIAYMNLENLYGTDETQAKVFERALQMCDPLKVFKALINVYIKTQKLQQAEQLYTTMVRRFSLNKDVWTSYGMFLMINGKSEAARKLMQRSFKSLDKRDHIDVIVKFAQFEFKHGEAERGRTMFENTLSNYPKRTDIWSIYIDMIIKQGDLDAIRKLFERVIHLNLSPKKIKFFFKRYLEFEKKFGDENSVSSVKQKALEYVEAKTEVMDTE
ncbi:protein RRP5 homolog [Ptychodera flava]|uniref:protein RRP5 homolog n=1 Tax=Ptychodera flava TaxID=63121 RepID=UPI00396A85B9